jgi:hypothetical protein
MGKRWTLKEMDLLREMYQTTHIDAICETFGRKRQNIYDKARFMGLERPNHWRALHCPYPRNTEHRFQKGHTSLGIKAKRWARTGMEKKRRFKKGQVPHNKLPEELREVTALLSRLKKNLNERQKRNAKG